MTIWICETCNQKVIPVEGVSIIRSSSGFYHTMCCKSNFSDGKPYVLPKSPGKIIRLEDWQDNWEDREHLALKYVQATQREVDHAKAEAVKKRSIAAEARSGMVARVGDPEVINATAVKRLAKEAELALKNVKASETKLLNAQKAHQQVMNEWQAMLDSLKSKN